MSCEVVARYVAFSEAVLNIRSQRWGLIYKNNVAKGKAGKAITL